MLNIVNTSLYYIHVGVHVNSEIDICMCVLLDTFSHAMLHVSQETMSPTRLTEVKVDVKLKHLE